MADKSRKVRYDNTAVKAGHHSGKVEFEVPVDKEHLTIEELVELRNKINFVKTLAEIDIRTINELIQGRIK